jgi:asparagine synthase (glutamine-hydrolysing)
MCGITGVVAVHSGRSVDSDDLDWMTSALLHRGPDASGRFVEDNVGLGFRRLSIIDLETGHQPMYSEDGNVVMICNGEIYNHQELRAELVSKGHQFRSHCDVEVVVHLYEEYGIQLLEKINGQFGLAIYDRRRRQLFLARDHLGILPLYYTQTSEYFVFGSEIKAILRHPDVRGEVDLTGLDQILTFPGLVSPRTMFRGIHSLENGQYLTLRDGVVQVVRYWDLDYPLSDDEPSRRPDSYYVESLHELLSQAVDHRLRANVPVGIYLSGGLDSSLIAALAGVVSPGSRSFSISFPGTGIDESPYQRLMVEAASLSHHEAACDPSFIIEHLAQVVLHAECPVKETYNACSLKLSEMVRATGTKVVLSGEGADELFAGYVGYRFDHAGVHRRRRGDELDVALEDELARKMWGDSRVRYERDYNEWRNVKMDIYSNGVSEEFRSFDCLNYPLVDPGQLAGRSAVHQRSYLDVKLRLVDHLLSDHGDRMALANSVEARYPFLDRKVVEFATTLPAHLKVNQWGEKFVLKEVARGLVPSQIVSREKFGFRAPASPALLRLAPEWMNDLLSFDRIKRQGYFNPTVVERLKLAHLRPGADVHPHLTDDLLLVVLTFGILIDTFNLPSYS